MFFFAFFYIQILFSVSSWDGNQMMSDNHIVQKLFCLIHLCIDTTTKEKIKDVPANYEVKRSNKSAVSSLVHLHIFLFFSNTLSSHYLYILSFRKGLYVSLLMPFLKL